MSDRKKRDPWTDPDPQPGDFDEYIAEMKPEDIQVVEPGEGPRLVVLGVDETVEEYLAKKRLKEARASR